MVTTFTAEEGMVDTADMVVTVDMAEATEDMVVMEDVMVAMAVSFKNKT